MELRRTVVPCALALAVVAASPARAHAEDKTKAPVSVDLSGRWVYNKQLSDDAREKMREAGEGRGGRGGGGMGGPGGGGGGMGGPGGGMGGRGGGMGGPGGGRMGPPPGTGGDDDPREAMRSLFEPAEELTITATEPEIVITEQYGATRNLHPNGKPYKTDNGNAEIKTQWKEGKLVVEKRNARGGKLVETWELVPDRSRILLIVKMEGGFGPALNLKRVYDRAKEAATP